MPAPRVERPASCCSGHRPLAVAADLRAVRRRLDDRPTSTACTESRGIPLAVHEEATSWVRERGVAAASTRPRARPSSPSSASSSRSRPSRTRSSASNASSSSGAASSRHGRRAGIASPCPFKGLCASRLEDAPWFFGRERLVAELAAHLVTRPVIAIVGASGSGKSSLVRAGLLPALAEGALPGSESWRVVVDPTRAQRRPRTCEPLLPETRRRRRRRARLLVVVDQLEELFTLCDDPLEREAFAQTLARRSSDDGGAVIVACGPTRSGSSSEVPTLARLLARERRPRRTDPGARAPRRRRPARATRRAAARGRPGRGDPRRRAGLGRRPPARADRAARDVGAPHRQRAHARRATTRRAACTARSRAWPSRPTGGSRSRNRTPRAASCCGSRRRPTTAPSTSAAASASTTSRAATIATLGSRTSRWCSTAC